MVWAAMAASAACIFGIVVEMKNEEDDDDNATENEMEQSFW